MRILVACEESQAVTKELRDLGHEAYSCDIIDTSGPLPQYHIKTNVLNILADNWDMIIAFPPCTHLATSGTRHFKQKILDGRQQQAIDFFMRIANAPADKIAIENPIGIMSTKYKNPTQIIQPYEFGHEVKKTTCLWLKNLPKLIPTKIVKPKIRKLKNGKNMAEWYYQTGLLPVGQRSKARSKTFLGIAKAMASQWTTERAINYKDGLF